MGQGELVMRTTIKEWRENYLELGQVDFRCPQENKIIKKTMRPWKYEERAELILEKFDIKNSILEIGCGYGGLAHEILKKISVSYTVVDNELMLIQAKKFLGDKVEYIEAEEIETLQNREFELFISHACLSETPAEYRKYVLENIIKNCQKIHIKDDDDKFKPTAKMIENGYEMLPASTEYYLNKYFVIEKIKYDRWQFLFTGERRK